MSCSIVYPIFGGFGWWLVSRWMDGPELMVYQARPSCLRWTPLSLRMMWQAFPRRLKDQKVYTVYVGQSARCDGAETNRYHE